MRLTNLPPTPITKSAIPSEWWAYKVCILGEW